ncbi:uncharacterized protein RHIMIDRAFT_267119 [Rhizopus microsporus ATCC 52813]|uniref:Uncharacterized protein n=1 Tax=Rhizopus microsporus ATCC 52813 TaxID=1340429 RepID=A0A2G4SJG1_RHIZD|nr:uncharacterized protein RHIMIDRAFT_267119 [Rhizopus microsporus ATCC 52813]PHZ08908.1 hypothetical protein RHIMIDRAFT_267119 [Rhizopus microsporus ATCC 52813]
MMARKCRMQIFIVDTENFRHQKGVFLNKDWIHKTNNANQSTEELIKGIINAVVITLRGTRWKS